MADGRTRGRAWIGGLPWPVIGIGVVTFLVMMGVGLVPPALPLYAVRYSLSSAEVGLLLTSFSTGMLVFSLPGGVIADHLGFKRVALTGCALTGLGALVAATLPTFWILIGAQFVQGVGAALYLTTGIAAIVAQTPDDRVGRATATYQGVVLVGLSVAPGLGGSAVQLLGLSGPFVVYAVSAFIGLGISLAVMPADRRDPTGEQDVDAAASEGLGPSRRTATRQLLSSRAAIIALVVSFGAHWAAGGVRNTLVPLFAEAALGMRAVEIGWLLTGASVANVAVIRHAGRAIDAGRRPVTIWSMAGLAVSIAVAAVAAQPWMLFAATLMIGATKGYAGVVPVAVITDVAHHSIYGSAIGVQRTATSLGLALGPVTVGLLADALGFRPAFVVAACLLGVIALLAVLMPETAAVSRGRASIPRPMTRPDDVDARP